METRENGERAMLHAAQELVPEIATAQQRQTEATLVREILPTTAPTMLRAVSFELFEHLLFKK